MVRGFCMKRFVMFALAGILAFGGAAMADEAGSEIAISDVVSSDEAAVGGETTVDDSVTTDSDSLIIQEDLAEDGTDSGSDADSGSADSTGSSGVGDGSDADTSANIDSASAQDGILIEDDSDSASGEDPEAGETLDADDTVESEEASVSADEFDPDNALSSYMDSFFRKTTVGGPHHIARRYKRDLLDSRQKTIYDGILANAQNLVQGNMSRAVFTIDMSGNADYKQNRMFDLEGVQYALLYDHPELFFWYGRKLGASLSTTSCWVSMQVGGSFRPSGATDLYAVDTQKVTAISTAAANAQAIVNAASGKSDYDKLEYYLKSVDERVEYNHNAGNQVPSNGSSSGIDDFNPWEIIYVFDNDSSTNVVCEGYAKAFKYLCDKSTFQDDGQSVYVVSGTITSSASSGPHMWNIVRLNGANYLVDPTWCDGNYPNGYSTKQFMVGGEKQSDGSWTVAWNAENGYSSGSANYVYDESTKAAYADTELELSTVNYVPETTHRHSWDSGFIDTAATCTKDGITVYTCLECKTEKAKTVPALDHSWDTGKTTTASTCTEDGIYTYTCTRCGATRTEVLPATGHKWNSEKTVDIAPTCTQPGQQSTHCTVCGSIKAGSAESIPALGHVWDAGKITKAPTCTGTGVKTYTCTRCGATRTEALPATGHRWNDNWKTTKKPTAISEGVETDVCANDPSHIRTRSVAKLPGTIRLSVSSVPLKVGQKSVKVYAYGFAKRDYIASVTVSNKKVVTAKKAAGKYISLKGKRKGTAYVTVTMKSGVSQSFRVKVQKKKVTTKKLSVTSGRKVRIRRGKRAVIKTALTPVTTQDKITFKSSKKAVASVSRRGVITAKKKGTTVITVKSGKKKVKVTVVVY